MNTIYFMTNQPMVRLNSCALLFFGGGYNVIPNSGEYPLLERNCDYPFHHSSLFITSKSGFITQRTESGTNVFAETSFSFRYKSYFIPAMFAKV